LELFLEHLGQVYSRAQLLDHINPDSFDVADRVIDSHIKNLRRKITEAAEMGNRHEWIQAVYGVGDHSSSHIPRAYISSNHSALFVRPTKVANSVDALPYSMS
jgi:DNA-binding winged helix-turn-helix (wHTH) protein